MSNNSFRVTAFHFALNVDADMNRASLVVDIINEADGGDNSDGEYDPKSLSAYAFLKPVVYYKAF